MGLFNLVVEESQTWFVISIKRHQFQLPSRHMIWHRQEHLGKVPMAYHRHHHPVKFDLPYLVRRESLR